MFWTLFALSSIVFLIPYLLMFPALLVLRRKFPDQPRPYVIPGGKAGAWIATVLCEAGIVLTLFLFFYFPAGGRVEGARFRLIHRRRHILSLAIGWWLYWDASRRGGGGRPRRPATLRTKDSNGSNRQEDGKTVVVALGGNAILQPGQVGTFEEQLFDIDGAKRPIARSRRGRLRRVVLTHGNGPQVGNLGDPQRAGGEDRGADADGRSAAPRARGQTATWQPRPWPTTSTAGSSPR